MSLNPVLLDSVAPLLIKTPLFPSVTYCLLDAASMEYTPLAASRFGRIMNISHADAVPRDAEMVYDPLMSAVTNWFVDTALIVPALGANANSNLAARLWEVEVAMRSGRVDAVTYALVVTDWM